MANCTSTILYLLSTSFHLHVPHPPINLTSPTIQICRYCPQFTPYVIFLLWLVPCFHCLILMFHLTGSSCGCCIHNTSFDLPIVVDHLLEQCWSMRVVRSHHLQGHVQSIHLHVARDSNWLHGSCFHALRRHNFKTFVASPIDYLICLIFPPLVLRTNIDVSFHVPLSFRSCHLESFLKNLHGVISTFSPPPLTRV